MSGEPITPEARAAVEALLDGPVHRTERAAEESGVRFLLDGLGVPTLAELKRLVDQARYYEHMKANGFVLVEQPFRGRSEREVGDGEG